MKFKPIDENTYVGWKNQPLICIEDRWAQLTKGQTYICTNAYLDGGCEVRADNGTIYKYNKTVFRRISDIINENGEDTEKIALEKEIAELKTNLAKTQERIGFLERENALLIRVNDLEKILKRTKN